MKRYVDVDKVLETAKEYEKDFARYILKRNVCGLVKINKILEDTPTADVVEVVRCKDCRHAKPCDVIKNWCVCDIYGTTKAPYHFCSCGERRE